MIIQKVLKKRCITNIINYFCRTNQYFIEMDEDPYPSLKLITN